jgi:glucose/arabinose dehydrogenase
MQWSITRRAAVVLAASIVAVAGCAGPSSSGGGPATTPPSGAPTATAAPTGGAAAGSTSIPASAAPSATAATGGPPGVPAFHLALEPLASGLEGPLDVAVRTGEPDALYVAEQVGRIRVVRAGVVAPDPVLDIAGSVTAGGEQGLLGLAFHPDPADGRLFVYYTASDGQQVVSSFRMDPAAPDRADRGSEQVFIRMADPYGNHNGGGMVFGPDGYLYISTGDGGSAGDPLDSGRHLDTLLAKILRIDVDSPPTRGTDGPAYAIPPDNPFVDTAGAMPEVWHTGLRNPWRFRFDAADGDMWIGDVGQGSWEEIDRAPAGVGGLDFGWNWMEGTHCYGDHPTDCQTPEMILPVAEYGHDEGCSVTGGTVYRGAAQPALQGWYVFADYCSGRFWVIDAAAAAGGIQAPNPVLDSGRNISAIAPDSAGELIATDLGSGELLRIVATPD